MTQIIKIQYNNIYYIIESLKIFFLIIFIAMIVFIFYFNFQSILDYDSELVQSQKPSPSCNYHQTLERATQKCNKTTGFAFKKNNIYYEVDYKPSTNYINICKNLCGSTNQIEFINNGSGFVQPLTKDNIINYDTEGKKYFLSNLVGNGSGMAISITVTNGIIKSIKILNQGNEYQVQDVIKISGGTTDAIFSLLKTKTDILRCNNDSYNECNKIVSPATGCNNPPPMAVDIDSKLLYPQQVILNSQGIC